MSLRFFLYIAENTGEFSYEILLVKVVQYKSLCHNYSIVHNIVRPKNLDCSNTPNITQDNEHLIFRNKKDKEIIILSIVLLFC